MNMLHKVVLKHLRSRVAKGDKKNSSPRKNFHMSMLFKIDKF